MIRDKVEMLIEKKIGGINTVDVGKVIDVDWDRFRVSCKLKSSSTKGEPPIFKNIPLALPQTNKTTVCLPVSVGDTVIILYNKHNLKRALNDDKIKRHSGRKFSLNNAIAMPGLMTGAVDKPDYDGEGIKIIADEVTIDADKIKLDGEVENDELLKEDDVEEDCLK